MSQLRCAECAEPFTPRESKVRFCSAQCRIDWHTNERREAIRRYRERNHSNDVERANVRD